MLLRILQRAKIVSAHPICNARAFKNFGHKREPEPTITVLWHGFLTFTFCACVLNWKWIGSLFNSNEKNTPEDIREVVQET